MLNRLPLILIALVGCRFSDKSMGMGGGGTPTDLPTGGDSDGDDTGGGGGGGTGSAPVISGANGSWDFDSDPPRALIDIDVTDADGDLHKGQASVAVEGTAETWFIIQDPNEDDASDQIEAVYDPSTEMVSLTAEVDTTESEDVTLTVRVKDAQHNISEAYTFSPE
jgi:hypothetical protein